MPCQLPPRPLSALACALAAAGLVLAVAGCSNITPLGPDPAPVSLPPARDLGSPIIMQIMRSQPPTPTGECPAGSVALLGSEPNVPRAAVASSRPVQPVRVQAWRARWAQAEVQAWPDDLSQLDALAEFSRITAAAGDIRPGHGTTVG